MSVLKLDEEYADYLQDESRMKGWADYIAFPHSTQDVCEVLSLATENGWPVTMQGGRTGITGGCVPRGGLVMNLSRMNGIGEIDRTRLTVQPGAALAEIRKSLDGSGYFFPSDLTETTATIGGMISNNASGARSFRYSSVRPWIYGLQVVLASGETVQLERGIHRADGLGFSLGSISGTLPELNLPSNIKTAAGYYVRPNMDLVDLFIGAEGTLGVITEAVLQLLPRQAALCGLAAFFASEADALEFVVFLRDYTKPVSIEFFDNRALDLLRRMKREYPAFSELPDLPPGYHTALYFEFEGEIPYVVIEELEKAVDCWIADHASDIDILKNFRHAVPESANMLIGERKRTVPDLTKLGTDMSVPDGQLDRLMRIYHEGLDQAGLEYVIFGHIGDNHLHVNILPRSMEEYERGRALYFSWAKEVVNMGGSVSAEHGIGKLKTDFLQLMFSADGLEKMQSVKRQLDPAGLLNPGNLFRCDDD